jgi:hypothetical protein
MRGSLLFLAGALLASAAHADLSVCTSKSAYLELDPSASSECRAAGLEGMYQIKLCVSEQGTLTASDGSTRHLVHTGQAWVSWKETIDATANTSTVETLRIDSQVKKLSISIEVKQSDGTLLNQLDCTGILTRSAQ